MILSLRTDKPEAEIGLFDVSGKRLAYKTWLAHRELSETLLKTAEEILASISSDFPELKAAVFYEGPGSFTGLRIGAAFVNALEISVVNSSGEKWIEDGLARISEARLSAATPQYGADPHITQQKK